MKYFTFLAILPCLLAAEVQNTVCGDGTQCPQGKYCCESGCCDISKELQDKGYVPAVPPTSPLNVIESEAEPNITDALCWGTQCGPYCHPNVYGATCCNNLKFACPADTKCCNSSDEQPPWCCKISERCSTTRYMCISREEDTCDGTQCGSHCHPDIYGATCCNNPKVACPHSMKCCSNPYTEDSWCCHRSHRCSLVTTNLCISGAATFSIAMMSVLLAVMIGVASKYFL